MICFLILGTWRQWDEQDKILAHKMIFKKVFGKKKSFQLVKLIYQNIMQLLESCDSFMSSFKIIL